MSSENELRSTSQCRSRSQKVMLGMRSILDLLREVVMDADKLGALEYVRELVIFLLATIGTSTFLLGAKTVQYALWPVRNWVNNATLKSNGIGPGSTQGSGRSVT